MLSTEFKSFINQVTCDSSSKDCMSSKCNKCKDLIDTFTPSNPAEIMKYQQWQTDDKMEKVDIITTVSDTFVELKSQLRVFLLHTYVKRKQGACMKKLISKSNKQNALLYVEMPL